MHKQTRNGFIGMTLSVAAIALLVAALVFGFGPAVRRETKTDAQLPACQQFVELIHTKIHAAQQGLPPSGEPLTHEAFHKKMQECGVESK